MNGQPQLSIIIVNHRTEAVLGDCLKAIAESQCSLTIEVIIIENPADNSIEAVGFPNGLSLKRIAVPERVGFATACNLGAKHASGDLLLFLNPDVVLENKAISILYDALTSKEAASIVVGRLTGMDGKFQASCRRFPTYRNLFFSRGSLLYRVFGIRVRAYTLPDFDDTTQVEAAAAAMMMMSKANFEKLSGFDERFFMYLEDTDLCYRTRQTGGKIYYVPEASGKHFWGYSTAHYRFRRIVWHHRSMWRYMIKHGRFIPAVLFLAPALLTNCFLSLVAELFTFRK